MTERVNIFHRMGFLCCVILDFSFSLRYIEVDMNLLQLERDTRVFMKDMNNRIIFTRADKDNMTMALGQMYILKVTEMLQDVDTY